MVPELGPSLPVHVAGATPVAPLPSRLSAPPPEAARIGIRERFRSLGKLWGGGLFSAEPSSGSRQWPLWERVRKAVLTPLGDLCRTALGSLAHPFLPEQERPTKLHGLHSSGLWPHLSCISVCSPAFWLGNQGKSSFIFRVPLDPSSPPAKRPTALGLKMPVP